MQINKSREFVDGVFTAMELAHLRCQMFLMIQLKPGIEFSNQVTPFWNIALQRDKYGNLRLIQGNLEVFNYNSDSGIIVLDYPALNQCVPKEARRTNPRAFSAFLLGMFTWLISEMNGSNEFVHDEMLRTPTRKKVYDLHSLLERVVELRYGPLYDRNGSFVQEVGGGIGVYTKEGMLEYWSNGHTASTLCSTKTNTVKDHFEESIRQIRAKVLIIRSENSQLHRDIREKLVQGFRQKIRQIQLAESELRNSGKATFELVTEYRAALQDGSSVEFMNDRITYNHHRGGTYIGTAIWWDNSEYAKVERNLVRYIEDPLSPVVNLTSALEEALNQYKAFLLSQISKVTLGIPAGFPITDKAIAEKYVVYMSLRDNGYKGTFEDYNILIKGK